MIGGLGDMDNLEIIQNVDAQRFELKLDDKLAMVEYNQNERSIIFSHTEVPVEYEGQGIGAKLAKYALEYAREKNLKVIPTCPFIKAYILRHPEYKENSWGV